MMNCLATNITTAQYNYLLERAKSYHPVNYNDVLHDLLLVKKDTDEVVKCLKNAGHFYNSVILKDLTTGVKLVSCRICKEELPAYAFKTVINNALKYFRTECMSCANKRLVEKYHSDPEFREKIRLKSKRYMSLPHVKLARKAYLSKPYVVQRRKSYLKEYRKENKEDRKQYEIDNKKRILKKRAEWRERNREHIRNMDKLFREQNRESINSKRRKNQILSISG